MAMGAARQTLLYSIQDVFEKFYRREFKVGQRKFGSKFKNKADCDGVT